MLLSPPTCPCRHVAAGLVELRQRGTRRRDDAVCLPSAKPCPPAPSGMPAPSRAPASSLCPPGACGAKGQSGNQGALGRDAALVVSSARRGLAGQPGWGLRRHPKATGRDRTRLLGSVNGDRGPAGGTERRPVLGGPRGGRSGSTRDAPRRPQDVCCGVGGERGAAGFVQRLRGRSGTDRRGEGGEKPERVSKREEESGHRPGIREELATTRPFTGTHTGWAAGDSCCG